MADAETPQYAGVMELVDVADSKSADGDIVRVRVPSPAPRRKPCEQVEMAQAPFL